MLPKIMPRGRRMRQQLFSCEPKTQPSSAHRRMLRGRNLKLTEDPHRRLNALTNEWVLVSPHRATRPWQGEVAPSPHRAGAQPTIRLATSAPETRAPVEFAIPSYSNTFVFDNDFAALKPQTLPRSSRRRRHGPAGRRVRARNLPRDLLLSAPRSHARDHGTAGNRTSRRHLDRTISRAERI